MWVQYLKENGLIQTIFKFIKNHRRQIIRQNPRWEELSSNTEDNIEEINTHRYATVRSLKDFRGRSEGTIIGRGVLKASKITNNVTNVFNSGITGRYKLHNSGFHPKPKSHLFLRCFGKLVNPLDTFYSVLTGRTLVLAVDIIIKFLRRWSLFYL